MWFNTPPEVCKKRVTKRRNHPTLKNKTKVQIGHIIDGFLNRLEEPTCAEGFDKIYNIVTDEVKSKNCYFAFKPYFW